jgi:hypothetical protein
MTVDSSHSTVIDKSVAREEKSGILYVHIYLPATGLHQLAGFPPAPNSSSSLVPRWGQLRGRWLAGRRRECKMGRPHQTLRGEWHLSSPCMRQSLLGISDLSGQCEKQIQASAAGCSPFPFRLGETFKAEDEYVPDPGQLCFPTV